MGLILNLFTDELSRSGLTVKMRYGAFVCGTGVLQIPVMQMNQENIVSLSY